MSFNWQQDDWPCFNYDLQELTESLQLYAARTERLCGQTEAFHQATALDVAINATLEEAMMTSGIEGEVLSRQDVVSSIRNNLGLTSADRQPKDQRAVGIATLLVDVRSTFEEPLSATGLRKWHKFLMSGNPYIKTGAWRTGTTPMRVVSGTIGKETVHFVAPPSQSVPREMATFVRWFNKTAPGAKEAIEFAPIRSAIAHLYFESIHPFVDGNGRIGRAIAEKSLFQNAGMALPMSLSQSIQSNRQLYYQELQKAQASNCITPWLDYFLSMLLNAQDEARERVQFVIKKMKFFDQHGKELNLRQEKVIVRMFEEGPAGFEGGMNAKKYMRISRTSKATATRDLQDLHGKGIFSKNPGGGRSTSYALVY